MRLVIVGPGRIGLSLAADLAASDAFGPIAVVGPEPSPPPFLSAVAGVSYVGFSAVSAVAPSPDLLRRLAVAAGPEATGVVFAVPDRALSEAVAGWAEAVSMAGLRGAGVALHTSGFHAASALDPLVRAGWRAGGWHPLAAVAAPRRGAFRERSVGVDGDAGAMGVGERLARAVGGLPVRIPAGEKARWHAAAVLASNSLVACLSAAVRELPAAANGEPDEAASLRALLPLARSALEEVASHGLAGGLTGPVARGDAGTVEGHLASLDPTTAALYRALAAELLRLASPRLDPEARRALRTALHADDLEPSPG